MEESKVSVVERDDIAPQGEAVTNHDIVKNKISLKHLGFVRIEKGPRKQMGKMSR